MASKEELIAMGLKDKEKTEIKEKSISSFGKKESKAYNTKNIINKYTNKNNSMATVLSIIGGLEIIGSFILGIVMGNEYEIGIYYKEFNTFLCVGIIIAGIIIGTFILGLAEIIQKLQNIEDNTRK